MEKLQTINEIQVIQSSFYSSKFADYGQDLEVDGNKPPNNGFLSKKKFVKRYTRFHFKRIFQLMGCKPLHSHQITSYLFGILENPDDYDLFGIFGHETVDQTLLESEDIAERRVNGTVKLHRFEFLNLVHESLQHFNYKRKGLIGDFSLSAQVHEKKRSFVILLSGTSGCGKSTLASLVASRLGIQNVLSTDSIRHTLRNFTPQEKCPILFASTYNAGEFVGEKEVLQSNDGNLEEKILHKKKTLMGYQKQCSLIYDKLETILSSYQVSNRSLIVEGVHLYNKTLLKLMRKYPNVIPFVLYIKSAKKQKERFAVRSKYMTLDTTKNKYAKYFDNIRLIQGSQVKLAKLHLIPTIENSNTDKSVSLIHHTVFKCLRKFANGEKLYDPKVKKAKTIHQVYERKIKNTPNTESAQKILSQKNLMEHLNLERQKNPQKNDSTRKLNFNNSKGNERNNLNNKQETKTDLNSSSVSSSPMFSPSVSYTSLVSTSPQQEISSSPIKLSTDYRKVNNNNNSKINGNEINDQKEIDIDDFNELDSFKKKIESSHESTNESTTETSSDETSSDSTSESTTDSEVENITTSIFDNVFENYNDNEIDNNSKYLNNYFNYKNQEKTSINTNKLYYKQEQVQPYPELQDKYNSVVNYQSTFQSFTNDGHNRYQNYLSDKCNIRRSKKKKKRKGQKRKTKKSNSKNLNNLFNDQNIHLKKNLNISNDDDEYDDDDDEIDNLFKKRNDHAFIEDDDSYSSSSDGLSDVEVKKFIVKKNDQKGKNMKKNNIIKGKKKVGSISEGQLFSGYYDESKHHRTFSISNKLMKSRQQGEGTLTQIGSKLIFSNAVNDSSSPSDSDSSSSSDSKSNDSSTTLSSDSEVSELSNDKSNIPDNKDGSSSSSENESLEEHFDQLLLDAHVF
ncbi:p-loop ntpase domain-containing protein lpa1 [Anaeramoeba flamelloides]|uniref:P-loop ntpase domain-containing protein lpa1 n=1 Tax=Anaeramoeba flamelloides TaxID=1746091 RepID=A0ABQ8Y0W5_9EUKA|nr:p-loop ntpase domain-containing protein lpa1 [Anaeramoeba flamelloides]